MLNKGVEQALPVVDERFHARSWIDHICYRGLLGSVGYYKVHRTLQYDGAIMRIYVSLNDVVWC